MSMAVKGGTRGVFKALARGSKAFLSVYFGVVPRPPKDVVTGQRFSDLHGAWLSLHFGWIRVSPRIGVRFLFIPFLFDRRR